MPCGDGTGPLGTGPIGLGLGHCRSGVRFRQFGLRRFSRPITLTKEEERKILKAEKEELEKELEEINKRLK